MKRIKNKKNLSKHDGYSIGYYEGQNKAMQWVIDTIRERIEKPNSEIKRIIEVIEKELKK